MKKIENNLDIVWFSGKKDVYYMYNLTNNGSLTKHTFDYD